MAELTREQAARRLAGLAAAMTRSAGTAKAAADALALRMGADALCEVDQLERAVLTLSTPAGERNPRPLTPSEQALYEEVCRLRARVAELEQELAGCKTLANATTTELKAKLARTGTCVNCEGPTNPSTRHWPLRLGVCDITLAGQPAQLATDGAPPARENDVRVPSAYQRCRRKVAESTYCHATPVADIRRGRWSRQDHKTVDNWWAYCAEHLRTYGYEVRGGRVWRLGTAAEPAQPASDDRCLNPPGTCVGHVGPYCLPATATDGDGRG